MQANLLIVVEKWVISPGIRRTLVGFYHRVEFQLENMHNRRDMTGRWVYPPMENAIKEVRLDEVETYVLKHQNTVAQYIATWAILDLCLAAERRPGAKATMRWWKQAGLDLRQEDMDMEIEMEEKGKIEDDVEREVEERRIV